MDLTLNLSSLEKKLGVKFKDINLLKQALTHRSYLNENINWGLGHNERLEFLGDAVLELVTSEWLYHHYSEANEGLLTSLRAALVNTRHLYAVAQELDLEKYLLISRGASKDNIRSKISICADAIEALIGALYLDIGWEAAKDFIERHILVDADEILKNFKFKDPKSLFQEWAQERFNITPLYKTLDSWGPDHDKHFLVGLYLGDELISKAEGSSKQEAEEAAASEALKIKGLLEPH
jgi:ribonuclease-3